MTESEVRRRLRPAFQDIRHAPNPAPTTDDDGIGLMFSFGLMVWLVLVSIVVYPIFSGGRGGGMFRSRENLDQVRVDISLSDAYTGGQFEYSYPRHSVCPVCGGHGAQQEHISLCSSCQGHGSVVQQFRMGGFVQNMQQTCRTCGGSGKHIQQPCVKCTGRGFFDDKDHTIQLSIPAGIRSGSVEYAYESGNHYPGHPARDIALEFNVEKRGKAHAGGSIQAVSGEWGIRTLRPLTFSREGHRLEVRVVLLLREALLGFTASFAHLDGHIVSVSRSSITRPGETVTIEGEGMPIHKPEDASVLSKKHAWIFGGLFEVVERGDLHVTFDVELPTDKQQRMEVAEVL